MKRMIGMALLGSVVWLGLIVPRPLRAQACKDEESMADAYKKSITDLVGTVKKESLEDFQKAYHQRSCLSKLSLYSSTLNQTLSCLDKAAQDTTATKEEVDAYKAKHQAYAKVKNRIEREREQIKSADEPKSAKAVIENTDLSN